MTFLQEISKFDINVIKIAFGKHGLSLYEFSKIVDHDHPELKEHIPEDLSNKNIEILDFINHGYKNNLHQAIDGISKFYSKFLYKIKDLVL